MADPIAPVSELRGEELRALASTTWWRLAIVAGPLAAGGVAAAVLAGNRAGAFAIVAAVVAFGGLIGTFALANSRARAAFLKAWARSRGWQPAPGLLLEDATPLLRRGERRHSNDWFAGPVATNRGVLCHYTFEVRQQSVDGRGNTTTTWQQHPFTIVQTGIDLPGVPQLQFHPRSFGDNRLFDRIDSAVTSNRVVNLESADLERDYKLEVSDAASETAVRLLFEPAFMVWCLDQAGAGMLFEIENSTLVVAIPNHSYDAGEIDGLVAMAATVSARVADARQAAGKES